MDLLDQAGNIAAILGPLGVVLYALWKRVGGVLDNIAHLSHKLDGAIETQDGLTLKIDSLETHQKEINGGIIKHMQDDATALADLKIQLAHVEGRLDGLRAP